MNRQILNKKPVKSAPTKTNQNNHMRCGKETDAEAIENSGLFRGVYHVVGEEVDVLDKNKQSPSVKRLLERIAYIQKQLPPENKKRWRLYWRLTLMLKETRLHYIWKILSSLLARELLVLAEDSLPARSWNTPDKHTLMNAIEHRT